MPDSDCARAAEGNFAVHAAWLAERAKEMAVQRFGNGLFVDSGLPSDTFNVVCNVQFLDKAVRDVARAVTNHFSSMNRPFSWWVSGSNIAPASEVLPEYGLAASEREVGMSLMLSRFQPPRRTRDLNVKLVSSTEQFNHFAAVVAANWNPPDPAVSSYYSQTAKFALRGDCPMSFYVGYANNQPVSTGEFVLKNESVGVYSVATLKSYRHRGYASSLIAHGLLKAASSRAEIAFLNASAAGASVYARLGFSRYSEVVEYKPVSVGS